MAVPVRTSSASAGPGSEADCAPQADKGPGKGPDEESLVASALPADYRSWGNSRGNAVAARDIVDGESGSGRLGGGLGLGLGLGADFRGGAKPLLQWHSSSKIIALMKQLENTLGAELGLGSRTGARASSPSEPDSEACKGSGEEGVHNVDSQDDDVDEKGAGGGDEDNAVGDGDADGGVSNGLIHENGPDQPIDQDHEQEQTHSNPVKVMSNLITMWL